VKHAPLSPSQAHRWFKCPASITMTKDIVEEESEYAKLGTDAHLVAAARLQYEIFRKKMPKKLPVLPDEHAEAVKVYLDFAEKCLKRLQSHDPTVLIEERLETPAVMKEIWGTADLVIFTPSTLVVIDLKTGVVPVEVVDNLQLSIYAALARARYGIQPDTIELHLVQPRAYHPDGPIRKTLLTGDELDAVWQEVLVMGRLALSDHGAKMFASGKHCQFCPVGGSCRTRAQQSLIEDFTEADRQVEANLMSDREMGEMLNRIHLVEEIMDPIKKEAEKRALSGRKIFDHKLIMRGGKRYYDNPEGLIKKLRRANIDEDIWLEKSLVSFTKLEKLPQVAKYIRKHVKTPPGKLTLVPVSDPHPEADPQSRAKRDFENIPLPEAPQVAPKRSRKKK